MQTARSRPGRLVPATGLLLAALAVAMILPPGPALGQPLTPDKITPIDRQRFDIDYSVGGEPSEVELWYTDDYSQSWRPYGLDIDRKSPFSFTAPHEGVFGFKVIASNQRGPSEDNPIPGAVPAFWCLVDWHRPQVQITGPVPATPLGGGGAGRVVLKPGDPLTISYTVVDQFLVQQPVRIEYRTSDDPAWKTIAANQPNVGQYLWQAPPSLAGPFFLRVTAVDQVGNLGLASSKEMQIERNQTALPPGAAGPESAPAPPLPPAETAPGRSPVIAPTEPSLGIPSGPTGLHPPGPTTGIGELALPPAPPGPTPPPAAPAPPDQPSQAIAPLVQPSTPPEMPGEYIARIQPPAVSDQNALGLFVLEYTLAAPVKAAKAEPDVARLLGAMQRLVDGGMVSPPLGVALESPDGASGLIKWIRIYGAVVPGYRQASKAGKLEQVARQNLSNGQGIRTRFEKMPDAGLVPPGEAVAVVPEPRPLQAAPPIPPAALPSEPPSGPPSEPPSGPPAPNIDQEGPTGLRPAAPPDAISAPGGLTVHDLAQSTPPSTGPAGRQEMRVEIGPPAPPVQVEPAVPATPPAPVGPGVAQQPGEVPQPVPVITPAEPTGPTEQPVTPLPAPTTPGESVASAAGPTPPPALPPVTPPSAIELLPTAPDVAPPPPVETVARPPAGPGTMPGPTAPVGPVAPTANPSLPSPVIPPAPSPGVPATTRGMGPVQPPPTAPPPPPSTIPPEKLAAAKQAYQQALTAQSANDLPRAAELYQQALKANPDMVQAMVNLAGIQLLQKDYVNAQINYMQATNLDPNQLNAWFGLGRVQMLRNDPQSARVSLGRLLQKSPKDAAAWVLYGDACRGTDDPVQAREAWSQAIQLTPDSAIARLAQSRLDSFPAAGG